MQLGGDKRSSLLTGSDENFADKWWFRDTVVGTFFSKCEAKYRLNYLIGFKHY